MSFFNTPNIAPLLDFGVFLPLFFLFVRGKNSPFENIVGFLILLFSLGGFASPLWCRNMIHHSHPPSGLAPRQLRPHPSKQRGEKCTGAIARPFPLPASFQLVASVLKDKLIKAEFSLSLSHSTRSSSNSCSRRPSHQESVTERKMGWVR